MKCRCFSDYGLLRGNIVWFGKQLAVLWRNVQ